MHAVDLGNVAPYLSNVRTVEENDAHGATPVSVIRSLDSWHILTPRSMLLSTCHTPIPSQFRSPPCIYSTIQCHLSVRDAIQVILSGPSPSPIGTYFINYIAIRLYA